MTSPPDVVVLGHAKSLGSEPLPAVGRRDSAAVKHDGSRWSIRIGPNDDRFLGRSVLPFEQHFFPIDAGQDRYDIAGPGMADGLRNGPIVSAIMRIDDEVPTVTRNCGSHEKDTKPGLPDHLLPPNVGPFGSTSSGSGIALGVSAGANFATIASP